MARIPEEEVERIKREIALVRVVEAAGVELKPHGENQLWRCPFHDDKTPSLVITPSKNLWHCLGACQTGGSVIDWTVKAESVSIRHALELLRERHFPTLVAEPKRGRPAQDGRVYPKHSSVRKLPLVVDRNADDEALLRQVVEQQEQDQSAPRLAILYHELVQVYDGTFSELRLLCHPQSFLVHAALPPRTALLSDASAPFHT